ncbi:hypothetical protein [Streptomyces avermitilis]|uniref:hypothetical protein n=1 Tax=Streptomyces avermitilis TaxID=33903 RepID=UPI003F5401D1
MSRFVGETDRFGEAVTWPSSRRAANGVAVLARPGMDGTYTSGSTCNAYYGFDATTGAYMEFTVGTNQSFLLFDKPMTMPEYASAKQWGPTSVKDVGKQP